MKLLNSIGLTMSMVFFISCAHNSRQPNSDLESQIDPKKVELVVGSKMTAQAPVSFANVAREASFINHSCNVNFPNQTSYGCSVRIWVPAKTEFVMRSSDALNVTDIKIDDKRSIYVYKLATPTKKEATLLCSPNSSEKKLIITAELINKCFGTKLTVHNPSNVIKLEPIKYETPTPSNDTTTIAI